MHIKMDDIYYIIFKDDKVKLYKCFKEVPIDIDMVCVICDNYMAQLSASIIQPYIAKIYKRIRGNQWEKIDSWYMSEVEKNISFRNMKLNELLTNI